MSRPKKKGSRYTPKPCPARTRLYRRPMPHLFTASKRIRPPGGEWSEKIISCCGCHRPQGART